MGKFKSPKFPWFLFLGTNPTLNGSWSLMLTGFRNIFWQCRIFPWPLPLRFWISRVPFANMVFLVAHIPSRSQGRCRCINVHLPVPDRSASRGKCADECWRRDYKVRHFGNFHLLSLIQIQVSASFGSPVCTQFFSVFSHLMGIFYRTIRMVENGIKPVYVFDGKPPEMKSGEVSPCHWIFNQDVPRRSYTCIALNLLGLFISSCLNVRRDEKRLRRLWKKPKRLVGLVFRLPFFYCDHAEGLLRYFIAGEAENVEKFTKRLVKVTKEHNEECKKLLSLMGIPYIEVSMVSTIVISNIIMSLLHYDVIPFRPLVKLKLSVLH